MQPEIDRDRAAVRGVRRDPPAVRAEPPVTGAVDSLAWLSNDLLLVLGWFPLAEWTPLEAALRPGDEAVPLEVPHYVCFPRADVPGADPFAGKLLAVRFARAEEARGLLGRLTIRTPSRTFALGPSDLSRSVTDLAAFLQEAAALLGPRARADLIEGLAALLAGPRTTNRARLGRNLFLVREALREPLSTNPAAFDQPQGLGVDAVVALDESSFYVRGWFWDDEARVTHLTAVSPEGARAELLPRAHLFARGDLGEFTGEGPRDPARTATGFACRFQLPAPSRLVNGWLVELRDEAGAALEAPTARVLRDPGAGRDVILWDLPEQGPLPEVLLKEQIIPALDQLQARLAASAELEQVVAHGTAPSTPDVSVVVRLTGRGDCLEHQLAQFALDPEFSRTDLIYLLDEAEPVGPLLERAAQLFEMFRVPFRVAVLKRPVGLAPACTAGAALARGRLLVLLHPAVLPDRPGWLGVMAEFHDTMPGIGALGPRLLYEDDLVRSAGLTWARPDGSPLWECVPSCQGLHRSLPEASRSRPVPAVSGACLMVDAALYRKLGGLRGRQIGGEYEDADLCLRLREAGWENWYLPRVDLYRLDRGEALHSLEPLARRIARYNRWLHSHLWTGPIEAALSREDPTTGRPASGDRNGTPGQSTILSPGLAGDRRSDG